MRSRQARPSANRQGRQGFEITVVAPESPALAGGSVSGLPRSFIENAHLHIPFSHLDNSYGFIKVFSFI